MVQGDVKSPGPAERACMLGVTRHLKKEDSRSSYQRKEMMDSIRRDYP
jgi:hypothetical protein